MKTMMRKIKTVLFDLDGTLIPTEGVYFEAYNETALRELGVKLDIDEYRKVEAMNGEFHLVNFVKGVGGEIEDDELFMKKAYSNYYEKLDGLLLSEGFFNGFEAVEEIKAAGMRTCLVTSSPHRVVDKILSASNCGNLFEYVVTGEDVEKYKPDPEGYLKMLGLLGEDPESCLVVEDTARGLQAARRAGIECVLVSRHATVSKEELLKLGAPVLEDVWGVIDYLLDGDSLISNQRAELSK